MTLKKYNFVALIVVVCLFFTLSSTAQVGIGTSSPNSNAMLDVVSTTKGFLPPRMTTVEKDVLKTTLLAAASPATDKGMMVYDTTLGVYNVWDGLDWSTLSGGASSTKSLGNHYLSSPVTTVISTSGIALGGSTTGVNSTDFSVVGSKLAYSGIATKIFSINASISFNKSTTALPDTFTFFIVKNGTLVAGTSNVVSISTTDTNNYSVSISGTVSLAQAAPFPDYIEIWASSVNGESILVNNYNLILQE